MNTIFAPRPLRPVLVAIATIVCATSLLAQRAETPRGYIGVRYQSSEQNAILLRAYGLAGGVVLVEVPKGGPAEKAGLRPEDILVALDNIQIASPDDLTARMAAIVPGSTITVSVDREGGRLDFRIPVASFGDAFPNEPAPETATATPPSFGMQIQPLAPEDRQSLNFGEPGGILVASVDDNSFAQRVGIEPGDIIMSLNRHPGTTIEEFLRFRSLLKWGDAVTFRVMRRTASPTAPGSQVWSAFLMSGTLSPAAPPPPPPLPQPQVAPWTPNPAVPARTMITGTPRCNPMTILGRWRGGAVTDNPWLIQVDFQFDFNPDGTYAYIAGQGNAPWLSHQGTFAIGETSDRRYPCQIAINPAPETVRVNPQNRWGLMPLQSRDLMDDQPRTFLYKEFPRPGMLMFAGTWTDWVNDIGAFSLQRR